MSNRRFWIALLKRNPADLRDASSQRHLQLPEDLGEHHRPAIGDRVAIVILPGKFLKSGPIVVGTGVVTHEDEHPPRLRLRHRVAAPVGHDLELLGLGPRVHATRGWSVAMLRRHGESFLELPEADFTLIEEALLDLAYKFGPTAKRPSHNQPHAPGRRALMSGRSAAGLIGNRR